VEVDFFNARQNICAVRRFVSGLLIVFFLALGTGTIEYVHNLEHAWDDAMAVARARDAGKPPPVVPAHDDSNCFVHAQLHMPTIAQGWVPLLILLGLLVAFLTQLPISAPSVPLRLRLDCRGPPAC